MDLTKNNRSEKSKSGLKRSDKATLIVTETSNEDCLEENNPVIAQLNKRINDLELKFLRHEMVFRDNSAESADGGHDTIITAAERAECSYIEEYSQIPETSAFQRYMQLSLPGPSYKVKTDAAPEQFSREFTTYDGITSIEKRRNPVAYKKEKTSPHSQKSRHKSNNPVRDYRIMDTVHYLAQGEFASRDDGIKLTPSREAVLSDIIFEDVCRSHWPNLRLIRKNQERTQKDNFELLRLIDTLLRDRASCTDRRRSRMNRAVKTNQQRQENCRMVGKTGDVIVAHKNKLDGRILISSDPNTNSPSALQLGKLKQGERSYKSQDGLVSSPVIKPGHEKQDFLPGPSKDSTAVPQTVTQAVNTQNICGTNNKYNQEVKLLLASNESDKQMSVQSSSTSNKSIKKSKVLSTKVSSRRRFQIDKDLDHYILLPTLVVRTPSNIKRQKKFNHLYHRVILNNRNSETKEGFDDGFDTMDNLKSSKN